MRSRGAQITIAAVCLVLGIMLAIQFKTTKTYSTGYMPYRVEDLAQELASVTRERDALSDEVLSLREKLTNVRENDQAMADLQDELKNNSMAAGLYPVQGPGIRLTVNDNPRSLSSGENPNNVIVHDSDLLFLVNDLKASGAEAVSVNGERIVAMSEIRCAGTLILVNTNKIASPFVIDAIGNPDMLESGITIKGGWLETLKALGFQTHLQKMENINIPAYSGRVKFSFAKPVQSEKKAK